jgi:Holliday junction resolvase-like predicted endonuclease
MNDQEIYVLKSSGEREPFSEAKLRHSLERARAGPELVDQTVRQVRSELRDGIPTSEIYRRAFGLLRRSRRSMAARYSLKKAIMELGPTGHPFEKLVGEILKSQGFSVEVARTVQGACVVHEVDVVALKGERHIMVECKFHNEAGLKSDIKIALYVQARFEDIEKAWQTQSGRGEHFDEAWLVTNTRLTTEAIQYARCVGMKAIGWGYPSGGSLPELINRANLHPITSLTSLTRSQKVRLMNSGIVLCRELLNHPDALASIGAAGAKSARILQETGELCRG